MFLQLWPRSRTRKYRAARDRGRRKRAYRPGMDSLDQRCLLSAHVVVHLSQAIGAPLRSGAAPALVAFTIAGPKPAPSGGGRRLRVRRCLTTRALRRPRRMVGPPAPAACWRARPGQPPRRSRSSRRICLRPHSRRRLRQPPRTTNATVSGHSFRPEFRAGDGPIFRAVAAGEPRAGPAVSPPGPRGRPRGQRGDRLGGR